MFAHLDVTSTGQRFNFHKKHGDTVTYVFVINDLPMARCRRNRCMYLPDQLFARFVHADNRKEGIVG